MTVPSDQPQPQPLHFLHIGKAAGTQIGDLAKVINKTQTTWRIIKHPHAVNLRDLPKGEPFFFSVRHPVSRFVSGFYSRKRKGQPRILKEWTYHEKKAFARFDHANDLAEALFAKGPRGLQAMAAIQSLSHTAKSQIDWFVRRGFFIEGKHLAGIIRQEHFDADWVQFCRQIGIAQPPMPTPDPQRQHRNDYSAVPPLSRAARANLERWYTQDIEFYRYCGAWIDAQGT